MKDCYNAFMVFLGFIFIISAFYNYDNPARLWAFLIFGVGCWLFKITDH